MTTDNVITFQGKIKNTLAELSPSDKDGFTKPLYGEVKRYVVAFTHNIDKELNQSDLARQVQFWKDMGLDNINIWGRQDKDGQYYIDVSTSTDDFGIAKALWKMWEQIAIRDNVDFKEIRLAN